MIVKTHGHYIRDAYLENTNLGKMLVIDTTEKGLHPHTIISGYLDKGKYGVCFKYKHGAFVELLAENSDDEHFLGRAMRFENHCKDQKIVLFIPMEYIFTSLESLQPTNKPD